LHSIEKATEKPYPVHVKFDTGMNRLGFPVEDADALVQYFKKSKLRLEGILTHLHSAEDAGHFFGETFKQLTLFRGLEEKFVEFKCASHVLNSAGLLNFIHHQGQKLPHHISSQQGARPGISLYGLSSLESPPMALKPVMSLRSRILKYKKIKKGEGVSYSVTWKAPQESIIAVVPMGYADGYRRSLSNKGRVLFRGKMAPVVGTVCMDYFMIDLTAHIQNESLDNLGPEEVTLWGEDSLGNSLSVKDLAKDAGSISWEMLTGVSDRVPRIFQQGELS
jgi:alanine racemase